MHISCTKGSSAFKKHLISWIVGFFDPGVAGFFQEGGKFLALPFGYLNAHKHMSVVGTLVFNMGVGMTAAVAPEDAASAVRALRENGVEAYPIGTVVPGTEGVVLC